MLSSQSAPLPAKGNLAENSKLKRGRFQEAQHKPAKGERRINEVEAEVIRRVFREFAAGDSPKAISHRLNDDGIPGPRGGLWRETTIRSHRNCGTGLLNNEFYVGRLVWKRLRYIKEPQTGKRVSRINNRSDWIVTEVPELGIVPDELWERAKARQREIDATPRVKAIRETWFWEKRRKAYLLTGLVVCGECGPFVSVGRDYLACSAARKLGTGPVAVSCRPKCSFKPLSVRMRRGFSSPVLSGGDADCRSH